MLSDEEVQANVAPFANHKVIHNAIARQKRILEQAKEIG